MTEKRVLSDPVNASLDGPHRGFRRTSGRISRYDPDVSVFFGHPRDLTEADYADVARLADRRGIVLLRDRTTPLPAAWRVMETVGLVQYSGEHVLGEPDPAALRLTTDDVGEMTALVERTNPGPFLPRTVELGTYLGLRNASGSLIAMAGERMHPPGWTEISAVCTTPEARGRGLASRLIRAVAHGIRARGEVPFLHTSDDNPARSLYESMGFVHTRTVPLEVIATGSDR
ncbi:GCN5-related N-acetyltransferase OS=Tsukamurella paurometabola (strain ATCC 8368 / DSM / CCUG 35730 / CIP 100753 / JCM 10117 / KCTC 9821 / NBRC 16120 /NCIMB 702349 / NCTC 13040) OX=521096 GN=Tpau_2990 PE=4 SV=1 [Tsukamurella paurometabola]|uniref:GCN5-related N-acetyltransferase n=1 Tax=Tsukamurella paurometabola (strain ATCC 8368 / DSM 20162 / CCUG 35730 / CIP 100753 / JCM 10117 / KCTC 9821 / NBRC 16120 / NCIMB 702349 / NCTC 13040) TaxID=521096 RepID=D5UU83_TSUPD|nr:GNAT family N-acetyltransferase [Tsukamurella paurometabola]ADG79586.1 GCN5-related N-acetyltransferase [Tsukamurella paurometabola DSM 20162]SUP36341.1 Predicted acetyltransferase [Tsukamurella paurometabola]